MKRISLLTAFIGLCLILSWGFLSIPAIGDETISVKIDNTVTTVSGYGVVAIAKPITFNKISLFIISPARKDTKKPQEFITLKEGLAKRVVTVSEKESATVGTLRVINHSDKPLFIQGGDVVEGGQQDRTIPVSLVIQPRTTVDVPSLCVEPSRWTGASQFTKSNTYSCSNAMRLAILRRDQGGVWEQVRQIKGKAEEITKQTSSTSSFTEEITNGQMRKASNEYEKTFTKLVEQYPDALGIAYVLNGEIYAIEFFQNHLLFNKAYPKLIKAYAREAILNTASPEKTKTITEKEITGFLNDLHNGKPIYDECIGDSQIIRVENDTGIYQEVIDTKSKTVVHRQYINKLTIPGEELGKRSSPGSSPQPPTPPVQPPTPPRPPTPTPPSPTTPSPYPPSDLGKSLPPGKIDLPPITTPPITTPTTPPVTPPLTPPR